MEMLIEAHELLYCEKKIAVNFFTKNTQTSFKITIKDAKYLSGRINYLLKIIEKREAQDGG